jgi:uncharacterized protein YacL
MHKKNLLVSYRLFFALLGFSAIVTEITTIVEQGRFNPANFFSFFTIESNIFAVIVLILSALALAYGKHSKRLDMLRSANTLNIIVVGLVFTLLLSGIKDAEFTAVPWDNTVLHYIMPIVIALDWFIDLPKVRIAFKQALVWMVFPVVYVVYSLIRGRIVGWYPYPFVNPSQHGYAGVAITSIVIALGSTGLIWLISRSTLRAR